jgi:hypothetical protein
LSEQVYCALVADVVTPHGIVGQAPWNAIQFNDTLDEEFDEKKLLL